MVLLSEFLSVLNYYFCIISGMIKRSYSDRDGNMDETNKITKTGYPIVHCTLYMVYLLIDIYIYSIIN